MSEGLVCLFCKDSFLKWKDDPDEKLDAEMICPKCNKTITMKDYSYKQLHDKIIGRWSGYEIEVEMAGKKYSLKTKEGVRGINVLVEVTYDKKNNKWSIFCNDEPIEIVEVYEYIKTRIL